MNQLSEIKTNEQEEEITRIIRCMNCSKNYPPTDQQYHDLWVVTYAIEKQLGLGGQGDIYRVLKENPCCKHPRYYSGIPIGEEKSLNYWRNGGRGKTQNEL